jgi:fibronectin type 3 domain-containing protein
MVCILLYISPAATSFADNPTLTLSWDASTSTNVANYKIYFGTASGSYTQTVSAGPVTQTTITGLMPGTTYFLAATACADNGLESAYSKEISFILPAGRPDQSQPELSLLQAGTESVLRWPTNYSGFTLQWSSSPAGEWTDLASDPSISGDYFTYRDTASAGQRYYRLKR